MPREDLDYVPVEMGKRWDWSELGDVRFFSSFFIWGTSQGTDLCLDFRWA